jgi:hypothetical protein
MSHPLCILPTECVCPIHVVLQLNGKGRAIPVTGSGGCEMSRLTHYLDNRLTDSGKVVSLTRRLPFAPQEDSWYSILL